MSRTPWHDALGPDQAASRHLQASRESREISTRPNRPCMSVMRPPRFPPLTNTGTAAMSAAKAGARGSLARPACPDDRPDLTSDTPCFCGANRDPCDINTSATFAMCFATGTRIATPRARRCRSRGQPDPTGKPAQPENQIVQGGGTCRCNGQHRGTPPIGT